VDLRPASGGSIGDVWKSHVKDYGILVVNYYANWCIWSQRLKPVFEEAAIKIDDMDWVHEKTKIKLVAVDCADYTSFCREQHIRAYPTIYYYLEGERKSTYEDHRTVDDLVKWTVQYVRKFDQNLPNTFHDEACQLVGQVTVPRVPGNILIQAGSEEFSLSPSMTNVSHHVAHLSFGPDIDPTKLDLPKEVASLYSPLDGKTFIVEKLHTAPHHYINVVPNVYRKRGLVFGKGSLSAQAYQMAIANKVKRYDVTGIPEAQFTYKFSNIMLEHANRGQGLYHVLTNFAAIIGGTYAVMHMTNLVMNRVLLSKEHLRRLIK